MLYLDTSFIIPLFINEPNSARVRTWFETHAAEKLTISDWTRVEYTSALGLQVRMDYLTQIVAASALTLFAKVAADSLTMVMPERADYGLAGQFLTDFDLGLRAGDALHLAIAQNRSAQKVLTFDKKMLQAGATLKISISED
jgi:predicted nucleic acid-binding protein